MAVSSMPMLRSQPPKYLRRISSSVSERAHKDSAALEIILICNCVEASIGEEILYSVPSGGRAGSRERLHAGPDGRIRYTQADAAPGHRGQSAVRRRRLR